MVFETSTTTSEFEQTLNSGEQQANSINTEIEQYTVSGAIRAIMNKIAEKNFENMVDQLMALNLENQNWKAVIHLIIAHISDSSLLHDVYAELCSELLSRSSSISVLFWEIYQEHFEQCRLSLYIQPGQCINLSLDDEKKISETRKKFLEQARFTSSLLAKLSVSIEMVCENMMRSYSCYTSLNQSAATYQMNNLQEKESKSIRETYIEYILIILKALFTNNKSDSASNANIKNIFINIIQLSTSNTLSLRIRFQVDDLKGLKPNGIVI